MNKKIIIIILVLLALAGSFFLFSNGEEEQYEFKTVKKGDIVQKVSETGELEKGEEVNLSFESSGSIKKISIQEGDSVKKGEQLTRLKNEKDKIKLQKAQASLEVAQSELDNLLSGSPKEDVELAETRVSKAETSLENAKQHLKDVKNLAKQKLSQAYEDALIELDDAYLKIYNTWNKISSIQKEYFGSFDQESLKVRAAKDFFKNKEEEIKKQNEALKLSLKDKIDKALSNTKEILEKTRDYLGDIREIMENLPYQSAVSKTDKETVDAKRSKIISTLSGINSVIQKIASVKTNNQSNINAASSKVKEAKKSLEEAQKQLAQVKADPKEEKVDLYKAKVKQAESQLSLLESTLEDSLLKAPSSGQIIKIKKQQGENVQAGESVLTFLPSSEFTVEVDIYEGDINKVDVSDKAKISFVAFPQKELSGKVIKISPSGKLVDGVVYYEVTLALDKSFKELKPGLTADVTIITNSKKNVLYLPSEVIIEKDNQTYVEVLEDGQRKKKMIDVGIEGEEGKVEIKSGLKKKDKVLIP